MCDVTVMFPRVCAVAGTANFLSHLAYKRTQKRSSAKVAYDLETLGAKFDAKACRDAVRAAASDAWFARFAPGKFVLECCFVLAWRVELVCILCAVAFAAPLRSARCSVTLLC